MGRLYQFRIIRICSNDNAAWIQVIVQCFGFTKKFRTENDICCIVFLSDRFCIADRNRGFDDHDRMWIYFEDKFDHSFNGRCIKIVFLTVVVCRCRNDYIVSICVSSFAIQCSCQVKLFFCKIFFDIFVLNRRFAFVDQINFRRNDVNSSNMIVLCK